MRLRSLIGSVLLVTAVAACARAGVVPPSSSDAPLTADTSPAQSAAPTSTDSVEPTATLEPTEAPTPEPTAPSTPKPTPKPTPRPTKPPPVWRDDGGEIDLPFTINAGTTIRFRLWNFSAPATCSLRFVWPDSTETKLATKTAKIVGAPPGSTYPYGIDWNLTIPSTQVGVGTFYYVCTYLGVTRIDGSYAIDIKPPL